jgi:hypothetical protein
MISNISPDITTSNVKHTQEELNRYVWGPLLWRIFHKLCEYQVKIQRNPGTMTAREQLAISTTIWSVIRRLIETIPCASCREHAFYEHATASKLVLSEKLGLRHWIEGFHNRVNVRLGRKEWRETATLAWVSAVDLTVTFEDYMKAIHFPDNSMIWLKLREELSRFS